MEEIAWDGCHNGFYPTGDSRQAAADIRRDMQQQVAFALDPPRDLASRVG